MLMFDLVAGATWGEGDAAVSCFRRDWVEGQDDPNMGRHNRSMCQDPGASHRSKTVGWRLLISHSQIGHDNWVRALVFHPSGKFLLSASDDKTIRIWDLRIGRCTRTVEAHEHFVTCMAWGRASAGGGVPTADGAEGAAVNGNGQVVEVKPVMVLATGSVDTLVKVWSP